MGSKQKAVVSADARQLVQIQGLVKAGAYATLSAFVREAIDEKLERLRRGRLRRQLERYIESGHAREDEDLPSAQALGGKRRRAPG
ncbi:MAG TPA: hypothetical protein VGJ84_00580 [Polyangiaceae bacterium]|jgi:Arc/MetJ-type ribon-helix-helix transcriptional regulator